MSTDEYVPSDEDVRESYVTGQIRDGYGADWDDLEPGAVMHFDAWLAAHDARVRRDAAREALIEFRRTELALIPSDADEDDPIRTRQQALAWRIEMHLLGKHPEETP